MFHRAPPQRQATDDKKDDQQTAINQPKYVTEQTAVQKYVAAQDADDNPANQNADKPTVIETHTQEKEDYTMSAQNEKKDTEAQDQAQPYAGNRVDIPSGGYQRPASAAPANRAGYPAGYPTAASGNSAQASTPSYASSSKESIDDMPDTGRKLVIGQGITLSGEIESCDYLIVEGTVEAALKGANKMNIAESGAFYGTVEIEEAVIAGRFEGDLTVNGRLTIQSTGTITGAIAYKELAIEAGAILDGKVNPLGAKVQSSGRKVSDGNYRGKKAQQDNGVELPFADKTPAAAE